jgi:hypothetical protein
MLKRGARVASLFFWSNRLKQANETRLPLTLLLSMALLTLPVCAQQPDPAAQQPTARNSRIAPLSSLTCDRNQLTSWSGLVAEYDRGTGSTRLVIHTDHETVESAVIGHHDSDDPSASFRLFGQPFESQHWSRIESAPGVLLEGMRATAWVCEDPDIGIIIDWRPGEPSGRSR